MLIERKGSAKLSEIGKKIIKGIYCVNSFKNCEKILNDICINNKDILLEQRKEITNSILRKTKNASENIIKELEKLFSDKEVINEK